MLKQIQNKRWAFFLSLVCFLNTLVVFANNKNNVDIPVKGKVVNLKNGEAVPGASIQIKGTNRGTITGANGEFSLNVPNKNSTLVVSFIGFVRQEIPLNGKNLSALNISLIEDEKQLEEVVVVGYGEIRKSDLTGSVAKLKYAEDAEQPITSVDQFIQGRVSGVQITQNSGAPGSGMNFQIRGVTSITGSSQPLYVIDGFPVESGFSTAGSTSFVTGDNARSAAPANPIASLNPNDIESIEILKDASSTAIYGSRGANGVVLITTKKGKVKRDEIKYTFRTDQSQLRKKIETLGTKDFIEYANEARRNNAQTIAFDSLAIVGLGDANTVWQDLVYQTAISNEHNLSFTGGDERTQYAVSGNYLKNVGIVKNSYYTRGGMRANIIRNVNSKVRLITNLSGSFNEQRAAQQNLAGGSLQGSVITSSLLQRPILRPFSGDSEDIDFSVENNPLTIIELAKNLQKNQSLLANMKAEYKLFKTLTLSSSVGTNYNNSKRDSFLPVGTTQGTQSNGFAYHGENQNVNYLWENLATLNKTLKNKDRINAVVGYTYQKFTTESFGLGIQNFSSQILGFNQWQLADPTRSNIAPTIRQTTSLSSVLARANYSLKNRYLFTVTGRADGSSRLLQKNRWTYFPSAAIAWNVGNEKFMEKIKGISELKLRASSGITGNQNIGIYATQNRVITEGGVVNQQRTNTLGQSTLAYEDARWETTQQNNFGIDLGVLKNRLRFGFEYYTRNTTDLILALALPTSSGFSSYNGNVGEVENKGHEFTLGIVAADKTLKWNINANYSKNTNKVIDLRDVTLFGENLYAQYGVQQPITLAREGYPIGSFFGYKHIGVYQNAEQIKAGPTPILATVAPGDFIYEDINKDGKITTDDRTIIGNPLPDFTFGVTNDFRYKNLGLSVFIMGNIGQDVANMNRFVLDGLNYLTLSNVRKESWDNRWKGEGTSNYYPAARSIISPSYNSFSSFLIEDASFVRIKNVTLSYDLPKKWMGKITGVRLFGTATNLLTWTNYKGYDPEVNAVVNTGNANALTSGLDMGTIPQFKTFSGGFNISF
jgi:TonB-dependent starch-binding outer membrane protein SusC